MATWLNDKFNKSSGLWTDVGDSSAITIDYQGGSKKFNKLQDGWGGQPTGVAGGHYLTTAHTWQIGDEIILRGTFDNLGSGTFLKWTIRENPGPAPFTLEGIGLYIHQGVAHFEENGPFAGNIGTLTNGVRYTAKWTVESDGMCAFYFWGGSIPVGSFWGRTQTARVNTPIYILNHMYSQGSKTNWLDIVGYDIEGP